MSQGKKKLFTPPKRGSSMVVATAAVPAGTNGRFQPQSDRSTLRGGMKLPTTGRQGDTQERIAGEAASTTTSRVQPHGDQQQVTGGGLKDAGEKAERCQRQGEGEEPEGDRADRARTSNRSSSEEKLELKDKKRIDRSKQRPVGSRSAGYAPQQ